MIRLFPQPTEAPSEAVVEPRAEVAAEVRESSGDRPWVYTNMIASADGGTAIDGQSGQLGGPGDKAMFSALRAVADVIIVGASTVREERYRPPSPPPEVVEERLDRGQAARPRLAVVTRSLSLDLDLPLFDDSTNRPYVLTVESAPADQLERLRAVAEVVIAGRDDVDLRRGLEQLRRQGAATALSEGGPSLNGQLIADDLIDEWNLSLSPTLLGADSRRAAIGPVDGGPPRGMRLARVWADEDYLFCRWIRATDQRP